MDRFEVAIGEGKMSEFDFLKARELSGQRFSTLLMAALLAGSEPQVQRLREAFPELAQEIDARRQSPNGRTPAESAFDDFEAPRR